MFSTWCISTPLCSCRRPSLLLLLTVAAAVAYCADAAASVTADSCPVYTCSCAAAAAVVLPSTSYHWNHSPRPLSCSVPGICFPFPPNSRLSTMTFFYFCLLFTNVFLFICSMAFPPSSPTGKVTETVTGLPCPISPALPPPSPIPAIVRD